MRVFELRLFDGRRFYLDRPTEDRVQDLVDMVRAEYSQETLDQAARSGKTIGFEIHEDMPAAEFEALRDKSGSGPYLDQLDG